jgi:hypothetical protein
MHWAPLLIFVIVFLAALFVADCFDRQDARKRERREKMYELKHKEK